MPTADADRSWAKTFGVRTAFATLMLVVCWPTMVAAQEYPLREGSLTLSQDGRSEDEFFVGDEIDVSGEGFEPGTLVVLDLHSEPIALVRGRASGAGAIDVTVVVPRGTLVGNHEMKATGAVPGGGTLVLSAAMVVMAGSESAVSRDGSDKDGGGSSTAILIVGAVLVIALGFTLLRRRLRAA